MSYKVTKKDYIRDIEVRIEDYSKFLQTYERHLMYLGESLSRYKVAVYLRELELEQAKILGDKNYRPWND
jgi:hypothetical protein